MIGLLAILALDGPELAVVRLRDEINALIGVRKLELLQHRLRHFAVKPHMLYLAGVFRLNQEVSFDEFFKQIALLLFGQVTQLSLEVMPRGTPTNRVKQPYCVISLRHKSR